MTEDRDENHRPAPATVTGADARVAGAKASRWTTFGVGLSLLAFAACQEATPTSADPGLIPTTPTTVELEFDFDEFAIDLEVFGGYGNKNAFTFGGVLSYITKDFGPAGLEARTLVRFAGAPAGAVIQDTTGASVTDSTLTFLSGSVLVLVDTTQSTFADSTLLEASALKTRWASATANWTAAVDSVGDVVTWGGPGGEPLDPVTQFSWVPAETLDTIRFEIDSATVARWTDTSDDTRGLILSAVTPGALLAVRGIALTVVARPASNPDTLVSLPVGLRDQTFIYDPSPVPDDGSIWVGGAPAWRSVFEIALPATLTGPAELCAAVGCPVKLDPDFVTSATLLLKTETGPPSFQLTDSIFMIALPVLSPGRLPKSPLGEAFAAGVKLLPSYFGTGTGVDVRVPVTTYIKQVLTEPEEGQTPSSKTLALLALSEPSSLGIASFAGPLSNNPPRLRIVLTIPQTISLR